MSCLSWRQALPARKDEYLNRQMASTIEKLMEAEAKALQLFETIEARELIAAGKPERRVNTEIFELAYELFGIKKYWHKRI